MARNGYKYKRLTILGLILVFSLFTFSFQNSAITSLIAYLGVAGAILAGFMYAFSFTAFIATGILLTLGNTENILLVGFSAGIGSVIADLLILRVAKVSFENEFKSLYKERIFRTITRPIPRPVQHFLKVLLAMLIIASPLPDEAGVTLLANGYLLPRPFFAIMSFVLNTAGIFLILYVGKVI